MYFLTDIIIRILILYFLFRGAQKGFLRTLVGPIALIISCIIAFIYYYQTKNIVLSLPIAIFGPFVLTLLFSFVLKSWNTIVNNNESISPLSRLAGASLSVLWKTSHLAMMLSFIALIPVTKNIDWLFPIQENIKNSQSFALISKYTGNKLPLSNLDLNKMVIILKNPDQLKSLQSTEEFQNLISENKFRSLFFDQGIRKSLQENDFNELLSNPKLKTFFEDPKLIKKFLALQKKILSVDPDEEATTRHYRLLPNTEL